MTIELRDRIFDTLGRFADESVMSMAKAKPDGCYKEILNIIDSELTALQTAHKAEIEGILDCVDGYKGDMPKLINEIRNRLRGEAV